MSSGSINSLIIFLSLVVFSITTNFVAMVFSAAVMYAIWFWKTHTSLNAKFQALAASNDDYTDQNFHADCPLATQQSNALLVSLRKQLPKQARTIPLRPENDLFDDLMLDPITLELDVMDDLCDELGLQYEIDEQKPLWELVNTISDLSNYIATLKPRT